MSNIPNFNLISNEVLPHLLLVKGPVDKEFETKISVYDSTRAVDTYNRILNIRASTYDEILKEPSIREYVVESAPSHQNANATIRKITRSDDIVHWEEKIRYRLNNSIDSRYGLKYTFATEKTIKEPPDFRYTHKRIITRHSYKINDVLVFDMSRVIETSLLKGITEIKYEFEAEYLPEKNKLSKYELNKRLTKYFETLITVIKIVRNTELLYTLTTFKNLIYNINTRLSNKQKIPNYALSTDVVYKPRDLKPADLYGTSLLDNKYKVSYKTDGERKLLIWDSNGIWLLITSDLSYILSKPKFRDGGHYEIFYILDGEYVYTQNRHRYKDYTYYYVIFDVLMAKGQDIRNNTHTYRINTINDIIVSINETFKAASSSKILKIDIKQFSNFETPRNLWEIYTYLEQYKPELSYKEDGYIIMSNNMPYNSQHDKLKPNERVLTKYEDVCKWKPEHLLTIDFEIVRGDSNNYYYLFNYSVEARIQTKIRWEKGEYTTDVPVEFRNLPEGTILEHKYDKVWIPIRIRNDKKYPNGRLEALSIWNRIVDPIPLNLFLGKGIYLYRKYHNREKKILLEKYSGNLLDIGSGKGGDIFHWDKYTKVIAIEPNIDNVMEMFDRLNGKASIVTTESNLDTVLSLHPDNYKVLIYNGQAEDTEIITKIVEKYVGGKVNVVSALFSLSFFWTKPKLKALSNTIKNNLKPDGHFLYTVLDGNSVHNLFNYSKDPQILSRENFAIKYKGSNELDNEIDIWIRSATVGTQIGQERIFQTEYLVNIDDLLNLLNMHHVDSWILNREELLNQDERLLAGLYIAGDLEYDAPSALPAEEDLPELDIGLLRDLLPIAPETIVSQEPHIFVKPRSIMIRVPLREGTEELELYNMIRLYTIWGPYNGLYDSILNASYPLYINSDDPIFKLNLSRNLINKFIQDINVDYNLDLLSKVLNLGIVVLDMSEIQKISLHRYIKITARPFIIIGFIKNNNRLSYETIARRNQDDQKVTIFASYDTLLFNLEKLPKSNSYIYDQVFSLSIHTKTSFGISKMVRKHPNIIVDSKLLMLREKYALLDPNAKLNILERRYTTTMGDPVEEVIEIVNKYSDSERPIVITNSLPDIFTRVSLTKGKANVDSYIIYRENYADIISDLSDSILKLSDDGFVIIKLEDTVDLFSWSIIYYMTAHLFENVYIIKPNYSLPFDSRRYIMGQNLRHDMNRNDESKMISTANAKGFISIANINKDTTFVETLTKSTDNLHRIELISLDNILD